MSLLGRLWNMPVVGMRLLNLALGKGEWVPLYIKNNGKVEEVKCRDYFVTFSRNAARVGRSFRASVEGGLAAGEVSFVLVKLPSGRDILIAVNTTKDDYVLSFTKTSVAASSSLINVLLSADENGNNVVNITSIFRLFANGFLVVTPRFLLDQDFAHQLPWDSSIILGNVYFENIVGNAFWPFPLYPGHIKVSLSWQGSPFILVSNSSNVLVAVAISTAFENPANVYTTTMLVAPDTPQTAPILDNRPLSHINIIVLAPYSPQLMRHSVSEPVFSNLKAAPSLEFFTLE